MPTIAAPTPTVAEAQAALDTLDAQHADWEGRRATLAGQLAERERNAASAALGGTPPAKLAADLGRVREELGIADGALALLVVQREEARYRVRLAEYREQTSPHDPVHILVPRVARNPPDLAGSWAL